MLIAPDSLEFKFLFILTIILMVGKVIIIIFLFNKIIKKTRKEGKFEFDFLFSIFILILTLLISRILYTYFDFFLTQFDYTLYYKFPNILFWKIAGLIYALGFLCVLYVIDKKGLKFKLRGIPAWIMLILALFRFFYPVYSSEDFNFVSLLELFQIPFILLIPVIFIYIGIKISGVRKVAFLIVIGFLIYGLGLLLVDENILEPLRIKYGVQIHVYIFFISLLSKIIGLSLMGFGVSKLYLQKD